MKAEAEQVCVVSIFPLTFGRRLRPLKSSQKEGKKRREVNLALQVRSKYKKAIWRKLR
jgi:hypothetical protein